MGYALLDWGERLYGGRPAPVGTIQGDPVVHFDPFLIPLGERSKYTLISLSFSLELPNVELGTRVEQRMTELRGFIYDTLRKDFAHAEGIPPVQAVKEGVNRAMHQVLPGLPVKDIYISRFLAL
jgi:flagellar basal body-associated protein FliL